MKRAHRIGSRRGKKKVVGAVAASLLTAIYHMLKNGTVGQGSTGVETHETHRKRFRDVQYLEKCAEVGIPA
jgi:hypothetical protein